MTGPGRTMDNCDTPKLYKVSEIARMLGISPAAVRKRALRGSLPASRVGGSLYIHGEGLTIAIDPRDSRARKRSREMTITTRPWNPKNPNPHEWEVDIRYTHPTERDPVTGALRRLQKRVKQSGTESAARKWAERFVSNEIRRLSGAPMEGPPVEASTVASKARKVPTLAEILPDYLKYQKGNAIKERTIESFETVWDLYLRDHFGDFRLDQIGPTEIEDFKDKYSKPRMVWRKPRRNPRTGKPGTRESMQVECPALSPVTINQALRKLGHMFTVAKYLGKLAAAPTFKFCKEPPKDPECYSDSEIAALTKSAYRNVDNAKGEEEELTAMQDLGIFLLLLDTGIRVGELIAIHPDQVDLEGRILKVTLTESHNRLTIPKSNRKRDVPLTQRACRVLGWLVKQTPGPRLFMRFHQWKKEIVTWNQQAVWEALDRIMVTAGYAPGYKVGRKGRGPHKLRHTCATQMLESDNDITIVQKILGHARIEQTQKYTHLQTDAMQRASARFEARMTRRRHTGDGKQKARKPALRVVSA